MKKLIIVLSICIILFFCTSNVQASQLDDNLSNYINELNKFVSNNEIELDLELLVNNLKDGKGLKYDSIIDVILTLLLKQVRIVASSSLIIIILLIISSLIKSIQLDSQSEVIKITNLVCFASMCIILVSNFYNVLDMFKGGINSLSSVMQIISTFLISLLVVNGAITTVGIIEPLILFIISFNTFIVINIVIPLILLSIIFVVVGNLNSKDGITKLGINFRKLSLWILGILLTIFLGILAMQTSITKDVDSLAIKTTTSAVSNFVPVVGKFFSDSFASVIGATKVITKVGGIVGIIVIIFIVAIPIIKLLSCWLIYSLISIFSEIIDVDSKICKIIKEFSEVYKTMTGILIACTSMFIIALAIILNLSSNIVR